MTTSDEFSSEAQRIRENYESIVRQVRECGGVDVRVVAVTKTFSAHAVNAIVAAGCSLIGENYAQDLLGKWPGVDHGRRPEVHFIGRLQSNKVRSLAGIVDVWQSVDRVSIIDEIARRSPNARIMLQVNSTGEADKGGCDINALAGLLKHSELQGLTVVGLMTVGPTDGDIVVARRAFEATAQQARELGLPEVSMGMTADLELAIECGSTMVRVGSAIFGDRPPMTDK
jgi:pyridoxal phosphate enzyme (YggS family)